MSHVMEKYFDQTVQSISEILRFDSTQKPAEDNCPFGKENAACLAWFLQKAEEFGFETHNYDNYVGEVIFGEGEDFAVLAHLDVVPATGDWLFPPFSGAINDVVSPRGVAGMKIWGRGALDDKGPAVSCLYALKALKDEGFVPARKIKLIVGCNEESGWACMDHYEKVVGLPKEGFTPDANFPVIYAEKGILHLTLSFPVQNPPFTALSVGGAVNMVPDKATAILTKKAGQALALSPAFPSLSYDNTTNTVVAYGTSAHGSAPQLGVNALEKLLAFFKEINEDCKAAYEVLFDDSLALTKIKDETGVLTFSPDLASFDGSVLKVTVDIRIPATHKKDEVLIALKNAGVEVEELRFQPPLYNNPNGKLVKTLQQVYNKAAGTDLPPIAIGGGTYARAIEKGCAFGPERPEDVECNIHQPNEYVSFDTVRFMNEVYYDAIKKLTKPTKYYIVAKI